MDKPLSEYELLNGQEYVGYDGYYYNTIHRDEIKQRQQLNDTIQTMLSNGTSKKRIMDELKLTKTQYDHIINKTLPEPKAYIIALNYIPKIIDLFMYGYHKKYIITKLPISMNMLNKLIKENKLIIEPQVSLAKYKRIFKNINGIINTDWKA
jgi:hypothetical protein